MPLLSHVPPAQLQLGADILSRSIERGDWDDGTCDEMASAAAQLREAADGGRVVLADNLADELWGILGSDVAAAGLAELLDALIRR